MKKKLHEFIPEEWLESGEVETFEDLTTAWDRWRVNRQDWLVYCGKKRTQYAMVSSDYVANMEFIRAQARWEAQRNGPIGQERA